MSINCETKMNMHKNYLCISVFALMKDIEFECMQLLLKVHIYYLLISSHHIHITANKKFLQ